MKYRPLSLAVLFVFALLFGILGCWNNGGNEGNPAGPNPSNNPVIGNSTSGIAQSVNFQIVLPTPLGSIQTASQSNLAESLLAAGRVASVTFKLTLVNVGVATQPTITLSKTVAASASGTASATFTGVPALTCVGDIHIEGGKIGTYTDFHGAADLISGIDNTIKISPKGSKTLFDITATVIETLLLSPEDLGKIASSLAQKVASAVENLDLNSSTVINDAITIVAPGFPTASATLSAIYLNPASASVNPGEIYNLASVTVTATYSNASSTAVTNVTWTGNGVSENIFTASTSTGSVSLICSYSESGITKTASFILAVQSIVPIPKALSGIYLNPASASVSPGEIYNLASVTVTATYSNASNTAVTNVSWTGNGVSGNIFTASISTGSISLTCSYSEGGITKTAVVMFTVNMSSPIAILPGGIKMNFAQIPAGTFQMGSATDATPVHSVTITTAFLMGTCEVTQEQYQSITGVNPSFFVPTETKYSSGYSNTASQPVEHVSWFDAVRYCNSLSTNQSLTPCYKNQSDNTIIASGDTVICEWTANGYRLPTEAEWEYSCRANTTTDYYWGDESSEALMKQYAWYYLNAYDSYWTVPHAVKGGTQPVGTRLPNQFGLYDMSGNVWEWCWDRYSAYTSDAVTDPRGSGEGIDRVCRGGRWGYYTSICRSANRYGYEPTSPGIYVGFRIVRTP
ncbi:MAG: formylglycine-generating enzyme family protein [Candidatus Ozemobacteraceae bacterium]